jgi:hypothetical protein
MSVLLVTNASVGQYSLTVVSQPAVQSGLTTYRCYIDLEDATDRVSAIYGNDEAGLFIEAPEGAFNSPYNTSWSASGINPAFLGIFPELADDTFATIGLEGPAGSSGISGAADPSVVEDSAQPITPFFLTQGASYVESNTLVGASWYILVTAANGLPDENLQNLVLQVTTSGSFSGQLNYQIFPQGVGGNALYFSTAFMGEGTFMPVVLGCLDELACNYNEEATQDDGSCEYPQPLLDCNGECLYDADGDGVCDELEGCMDETACNYDPNATIDSGMCAYAEAYYDCDGNCINDTDGDGLCDEFELLGCVDMEACNYDESATDDDGSCEYAIEYYDCLGNCIDDTDGDGVCDELEVLGCMDIEACNYDEAATDVGSCDYDSCAGCMDENACNYDSDATIDDNESCEYAEEFYDCAGICLNDVDDDGVCDELEVPGCTDIAACNFDELATDDDGSCTYPEEDYLDCDGNCLNDVDGDGVCDELEVAGCTDMAACNYDEFATDDDGSCTYPEEDYLDCDGNCLNDADGDGVCDELEVAGCTNMDACNYDELATDDDGSCVLVGDSCDDGDENTINDTIDANCECVGEVDGVAEARLAFGLFPNPTTGEVTLAVTGFHTGVTVQVLDGAGRVVWAEQNVALQGNTVLDLSDLSSGTYNVMLSDARGVNVKRLAIQR